MERCGRSCHYGGQLLRLVLTVSTVLYYGLAVRALVNTNEKLLRKRHAIQIICHLHTLLSPDSRTAILSFNTCFGQMSPKPGPIRLPAAIIFTVRIVTVYTSALIPHVRFYVIDSRCSILLVRARAWLMRACFVTITQKSSSSEAPRKDDSPTCRYVYLAAPP